MVPARHLQGTAELTPPPVQQHVDPSIFKGITVMLVEDQALIAIDTEDVLRRLGVGSVKSYSNATEALTSLDKASAADVPPDCAVLDFNLGGDTSAAVADRLIGKNIPFVFVTGYGDSVMIPKRFDAVSVVRKPVSGQTLAEKLSGALQRRHQANDL